MEKEQLNSQEDNSNIVDGSFGESTSPQEPAFPSAPEEQMPVQPKRIPIGQRILAWAAAVLLSAAAGAALIFFLLYLPANTALRQAQADLSSANNALELSQTKADGLQTSLTDTTDLLESAQTDLESARLSLLVSRLQANISYARLALLNKDTLTARQELSTADANLADLTLELEDSETASALADRLKTIRAALTSDPAKALDELRTLGENLARLENR